MKNPSLIIIICLEAFYFSFSPFKIYHQTLMVFCYCLFSASFLISAFRRMGDCKGRTIRKLMGGGGGLRAKYKKKIRARENLI